ncbi:SDR family oxidoreductase [Mesorhizobium loti]|nr:SDR family oxidoreductase [Mesorhizobium loti]
MTTQQPKSTPLQLSNRVAIISGGGTGIGRAAALAFTQQGAKVTLAGRRSKEIQEVADEITAAGGEALPLVTDVTKEPDIQRLVNETMAHYGRLDIAFNNAGILGSFRPITEQTSADFDAVIATNLRGVWLSMKYQIEAFLAQGVAGTIVNTSSWLTHGALAGSSAYSASKGALDAMIRALVLEYGPKGIRINNINPGIIDTPMARGGWNDEAAFRPFVEHTPAKRAGLPEDAGDVAVWLSTDQARFVTGQSILVDGGYTIAGLRVRDDAY